MTTNPRRRLRLHEVLPAPWVVHLPEDDRYTPPPTDPAEDPRLRRIVPPWCMTFGQALFLFANTLAEGMDAWRENFPRSAEVFDGVHATEAGVDVQWITDAATDEETEDEQR